MSIKNNPNFHRMKADLVQTTTLRRSNSTSSLAGRLGSRRASTGSAPTGPRRRIKRNNIVRASSRQNLVRSNSTASLKRSNSRLSLKRSNSRQNLKRSNSRSSLNRVSGGQGLPQRRIARNALRGASSQRRGGQRRSNSVSNRLGVRRAPMARDRIRADNIRGGRARRGRILNRRNSTTAVSNLSRNGGSRQGRPGRPRGRYVYNLSRNCRNSFDLFFPLQRNEHDTTWKKPVKESKQECKATAK